MTDGLKEKHREAILDVLRQHPKVEQAVLFGSRAMGTFTQTSDVDIAIYGDLQFRDQAQLSTAMDELNIPQSVDLVRMNTVTSPELLEHIRLYGKQWLPSSQLG